MSRGWLLLVALVVVAVGCFVAAAYRAAARMARADTRQDLIKLSNVPQMATTLTATSGQPTYAFTAPFAEGRSHPFGWLWWWVERAADGTLRHEMGWALTYRRARKAAGLPLSIRARHTEITLALGHGVQRAND
ncbi:hypothetical protein [Streptomyces nigrescens]|uniref:Secreted protein n=1 Tax=Streptomyces nigrescens TaxID=1920 RepID=A0ABY7J0L3_STRNI|nr:hypothetical protein [Streptomyces nigrescens]WAU04098.1 hypothetical protein STRNI_002332 [Streptomyces nigrescens]